MLQRLEARRQQVSEAEVAAVERQMEEVRENVRKAEVGPKRAWGGLEVCCPQGVLGTGVYRDVELQWQHSAGMLYHVVAVLGAGSLGMGLGCPPPHCGHLIP